MRRALKRGGASHHACYDNAVNAASSVDPRAYRDVIGRFATGVTVMTVAVGERVRGMTANAVTSLSLDPTLLLVCVQREGSLNALLEQATAFAVNILPADQQPLAQLFARHGEFEQPMGGVPYRAAGSGSPLLEPAMAWIDCTVHERLNGGDHTIVVGHVLDVGMAQPDAEPLLFYAGQYRQLAPEG